MNVWWNVINFSEIYDTVIIWKYIYIYIYMMIFCDLDVNRSLKLLKIQITNRWYHENIWSYLMELKRNRNYWIRLTKSQSLDYRMTKWIYQLKTYISRIERHLDIQDFIIHYSALPNNWIWKSPYFISLQFFESGKKKLMIFMYINDGRIVLIEIHIIIRNDYWRQVGEKKKILICKSDISFWMIRIFSFTSFDLTFQKFRFFFQ